MDGGLQRDSCDVVFNFEKLEVYQRARAFKLRVYRLTDILPAEEKYRLRPQMRRAVLSIMNCNVEGHGRFTYKDRMNFMRMARGSLNEVVDDNHDADDLGYAKTSHLLDLKHDASKLQQLMNGYIGYLGKQHRAAKKPN